MFAKNVYVVFTTLLLTTPAYCTLLHMLGFPQYDYQHINQAYETNAPLNDRDFQDSNEFVRLCKDRVRAYKPYPYHRYLSRMPCEMGLYYYGNYDREFMKPVLTTEKPFVVKFTPNKIEIKTVYKINNKCPQGPIPTSPEITTKKEFISTSTEKQSVVVDTETIISTINLEYNNTQINPGTVELTTSNVAIDAVTSHYEGEGTDINIVTTEMIPTESLHEDITSAVETTTDYQETTTDKQEITTTPLPLTSNIDSITELATINPNYISNDAFSTQSTNEDITTNIIVEATTDSPKPTTDIIYETTTNIGQYYTDDKRATGFDNIIYDSITNIAEEHADEKVTEESTQAYEEIIESNTDLTMTNFLDENTMNILYPITTTTPTDAHPLITTMEHVNNTI